MSSTRLAALATLFSAVICGCFDTSVSDPAIPDGGTDSDGDSDTDSDGDTDLEWDTEFDGDTDQCDEVIGEYNTNIYNGYGFPVESQVHVQVFEGQPADPGFESIMMLYVVNGQPGEITDLAGQFSWVSCTRCLFFLKGCPDDDFRNCTEAYTVTAGTLRIGELVADEPWGNFFEFVATDVVVQSCNVDWDEPATELVGDGPTICIGAWHVGLFLDYG